jgi:hypothetical protein
MDPTREALEDLERFAREKIAADEYPGDSHPFEVFACDGCGETALSLTVEHHTGSTDGDFKGIIYGECSRCGNRQRLLSYTGRHRERLREETPQCECAGTRLLVAMCERYEGDGGIPGFFDEGVVVGKCLACGKNRVVVYTD